MEEDKYQERYLDHQARKTAIINGQLKLGDNIDDGVDVFANILQRRKSTRVFSDIRITDDVLGLILEAIRLAPSSCNRQAIRVKVLEELPDKKAVSELLVGGRIWLEKADRVLLFFADMDAYKSPNERDFMPFLDAAATIMSAIFAAESKGIGSCWVNPNIRDEKKKVFMNKYNPDRLLFCSALALGGKEKDIPRPPKKAARELLY